MASEEREGLDQQRIILLDRSRIVSRQECPRLRYLNYHHGGTGIELVRRSLPLITGIYVHEALAAVLSGTEVAVAVSEACGKYRTEAMARGIVGVEDPALLIAEQCALLEGLVRGWCLLRLPALLAEYEVVSVEEEFEWEIAPGMRQMLRMDGVLRHKQEGTLFILEFKTVANPGYAWQQQWERNIQFMSYTAALQEHTGEAVGGVMVEGLVKGSRKLETAASSAFQGQILQQSPFCYAYKTFIDGDVEQPFYSAGWKPGGKWKKFSTWNEMDMKQWVMVMEHEVLMNQFVTVPPIAPLPEQIKRWRRQVIAAESRFQVGLDELLEVERVLAIQEGTGEDVAFWRQRKEEVLDFYFPQHDNHCLRYGSPCSFSEACFNDLVSEDPIGSGLYQVRTPHHTPEMS